MDLGEANHALSTSRQCPPESSLLGASLLAALLLVFGLLHGLALMLEQYAAPPTEASRRIIARPTRCTQKTFLNRAGHGIPSPVMKTAPISCRNRANSQNSAASSATSTNSRKTVTFAETLKVHFVQPAYGPGDFYTDPPRVCLLHKVVQRT